MTKGLGPALSCSPPAFAAPDAGRRRRRTARAERPAHDRRRDPTLVAAARYGASSALPFRSLTSAPPSCSAAACSPPPAPGISSSPSSPGGPRPCLGGISAWPPRPSPRRRCASCWLRRRCPAPSTKPTITVAGRCPWFAGGLPRLSGLGAGGHVRRHHHLRPALTSWAAPHRSHPRLDRHRARVRLHRAQGDGRRRLGGRRRPAAGPGGRVIRPDLAGFHLLHCAGRCTSRST